MKFSLFNTVTGAPAGEVEIPDEVIEAAKLVAAWLSEQPIGTELAGLTLVRDK